MTANDELPPSVVLRLSTDLTARLHRWIEQRPDPKPGLAEAIAVLLDERLSVRSGAADDPIAAGGAAFETYGEAGRPINPHEPGTSERGNWNEGFETAKKGRGARLKPIDGGAK
jgi:hypothetical protein